MKESTPHRDAGNRRLLLDLDANRYTVVIADFDDLAALDRAGLAALNAATLVLEMALEGGSR